MYHHLIPIQVDQLVSFLVRIKFFVDMSAWKLSLTGRNRLLSQRLR
jgi:hypothetical protein